MLLVGFIPVTDLTGVSGEEARRETGWQLFHTCMKTIIEPIKEASRTGVDMLCADGGVHLVFPILAAYIADFPEQCLISCNRQSRCPICIVPRLHRGDYDHQYPRRQRQQTLEAIEDHEHGYLATTKTLGIRPVRLFWADMPYVDITTCITPDLLHQLNKGVFLDHLVKWCTTLLGDDEIDRRFQGLPRYPGLRHFKFGPSIVSQWTGNEGKAMGKVFLPVIAGCSGPEAVNAARHLIDFMYRAHLSEMSELDLQDLENDLAGFHDAKYIFVQTGALNTRDLFHGIPKLHMLGHFIASVRELGTTDGYNSEMSERLHINYVKDGWRESNKFNPIEQMAMYLQRKESIAMLWAHLREISQLPKSCEKHEVPVGETEREVFERNSGDDVWLDDDEEVGDCKACDRGAGQTWHPSPTIWFAKHPTLGKQSVAYLIDKHGAIDLISATQRYLAMHYPGYARCPLTETTRLSVWTQCTLTHNNPPFLPSGSTHVDRIRVFPCTRDLVGRETRFGAFDTVLFESSATQDGLHRKSIECISPCWCLQVRSSYQAGRVRAIFELPSSLNFVSKEKLVYLNGFRPFAGSMPQPTGLYMVTHPVASGRSCGIVIPLSDLRLSCHLVPAFHTVDANFPLSSSTDLLSEPIYSKYYLNKYCSHFMFGLMEYWC